MVTIIQILFSLTLTVFIFHQTHGTHLEFTHFRYCHQQSRSENWNRKCLFECLYGPPQKIISNDEEESNFRFSAIIKRAQNHYQLPDGKKFTGKIVCTICQDTNSIIIHQSLHIQPLGLWPFGVGNQKYLVQQIHLVRI